MTAAVGDKKADEQCSPLQVSAKVVILLGMTRLTDDKNLNKNKNKWEEKVLRKDISEIFNIALDGPAGSGKSTVAKILAKDYNILYLDTNKKE